MKAVKDKQHKSRKNLLKAAVKKVDFVYLDSPQNIYYNDAFNVTISSAIPDYQLNLSISCPTANYYNNAILVASNGTTEISLGTNVPPGINCTLQTIATDAFTASNIAEISIVATTIDLTIVNNNITAGVSNISYVLSSDARSFPVDLTLYCNDVPLNTETNVYTSNLTQTFPVANDYWGNCYLNVASTDPYYNLPANQSVSILSPITFNLPPEGSEYLTTDTISFNMTTGNSLIPLVTLTLTCDNTVAGSGENTGQSNLQVNIGSLQWYGNCISTIGYIEYYNTTATLNVTVNRLLEIVEPLAGSSIISGTEFNMNGTAPFYGELDPIQYNFACSDGVEFSYTGSINNVLTDALQTSAYGTCAITANSTIAYYQQSAPVSIYALSNTTIVTPSGSNGWVYYAGNSTINVTATPGPAPSGTATVSCSYQGVDNIQGAQIEFINGLASNYNMTGYGNCSISIETSIDYVNSSTLFSSLIPVTLEVGPISDVEDTIVTVTTPLTSVVYNLTLVGHCNTNETDFYWSIYSNGTTPVDMISIPTGAVCEFYTQPDTAFAQSNTVTHSAKSELFLAFDVDTATAGQTINVQITTSDSSVVEVNVALTCTVGQQSVAYNTSTSFQPYTLDSGLFGSCTAMASPVSSTEYVNSNNVTLTVLSPITISVPQTQFNVGESIPVNVTSGNGLADPVLVTVDCGASGVMGTNTSNANQVIYVAPSDLAAYGACTVTAVNQTVGYNATGASLALDLYRQLVISLPADGSYIVGGAYYDLNVTSADGTTGVNATVYATCASAAGFTVNDVPVNELQSVQMDNIQGGCLLTANTTAEYYLNSTVATQIYVQTNVTIVNPGPSSPWTYNVINSGSLLAASGQPITTGLVEIVCSYNGTERFRGNITVQDNWFNTTDPDTGYGACQATTYLDPILYVNTQTTFNTQTSVTITSVGQSIAKRLYNWAKSFLSRKK